MKYRFMNEHRHEYPLALMCRVLQVARAGFYAWLQCPMSDRARDDTRLLELIRHSYAASHGVYGARRVFGDLREAGESCGLHCVERLMQRHEIKAVRGYKSPVPLQGGPPSSPPTICSVSSQSMLPTKSGAATSPTSESGKGGCTWRWCWTSTRARWWAGR